MTIDEVIEVYKEDLTVIENLIKGREDVCSPVVKKMAQDLREVIMLLRIEKAARELQIDSVA